MDMRIEAAPMAAEATVVEALVVVVASSFLDKVIPLAEWVASFSCPPTLGSHSLSAVAPDNYLIGGTALAA